MVSQCVSNIFLLNYFHYSQNASQIDYCSSYEFHCFAVKAEAEA